MESNEIEKTILDFLDKHRGERFSIKDLSDKIAEETPDNKISYQTVLKYIAVLVATKQIKCEDYGAVKIVWRE